MEQFLCEVRSGEDCSVNVNVKVNATVNANVNVIAHGACKKEKTRILIFGRTSSPA